MTSDQDKCNLSSLIPMSCRGRTEEFARRLHSRLSSLGSNDSNEIVDENSWLAAAENPITISQPRQTDTDIFFDLGNLESPGSPEGELNEPEVTQIINQDDFKLIHNGDLHCYITTAKNHNLSNGVTTTSYDSDSSDGPFYDSENELFSNRVMAQIKNAVKSDLVLSDANKSELPVDESVVDDNRRTCSEIIIFSEPKTCVNEKILFSAATACENCLENIEILPDKCEQEIKLSNDLPEKSNGHAKNEISDETYSSCLTIDKKYTFECPEVTLTKSENYCLKSEDSVQNNINETDDELEEIPRVRRCSSLKTGKTPPGTPRSKKIVRFADVLGLDLADVRTFLDEIPKIPNSAYNDLKDVDLNESTVDLNLNNSFNKFHGIKVERVLVPLFQQPGGQPDFIDRIRSTQVCLDNALVEDPVALTITGTVRVRNLDFHKSVHVRYTLDAWQSFADVQATYVENSCDGFSDKFSFKLFAHGLSVGQNLEFAIRFQCKGCQYWDSNSGINYIFQCLPAANNIPSPPISETENLGASFY